MAMRRLLRGGKSRRLDLSLNDEISRGLGVNRRRVIGDRGARVDHRRGFGNVHQHVLGDIFGFRFARRHDRGDRLADEAHDAGGQDRLRYRNVAELMQRRRIGFTAARSAAVNTIALSGTVIFSILPAATALRTKRTR